MTNPTTETDRREPVPPRLTTGTGRGATVVEPVATCAHWIAPFSAGKNLTADAGCSLEMSAVTQAVNPGWAGQCAS